MREAIESGHRALGATVEAVWWWPGRLPKPYSLSLRDIPLPSGRRAYRRTPQNTVFLNRGLAAKVDVLGAVLASLLVLLELSWGPLGCSRCPLGLFYAPLVALFLGQTSHKSPKKQKISQNDPFGTIPERFRGIFLFSRPKTSARNRARWPVRGRSPY